MSLVKYVERKNMNCAKWDGLMGTFGEDGLLAMWVADMDFQVPKPVIKALSDYVNKGVFGYPITPDSYLQAFIDWEKKYHSYEVEKDWIRFSPGVVSAFNWIIQFMTNSGDAVIVTTPVYYPFLNAVKDNNRNLIMSDLIETNGVYTMDFADFEQKIIDNQVSLFILCSPHNPVGRVWKREELAKLLDICRKHNVFVISDEIHHDLTYSNHKHIPSATVGNYDDMLITLTAPSKTFNLAACQNSIIIIPDETLRCKWDTFVNQIRVTEGNAFGYIAAEAAYKDGRAWFEEIKEIIYGNYLYMKETLENAFPEIIVSPLEGTYLAWIDLKNYVKTEDVKDFMQKKCKLAFDYGDWFGGERFGTHVRMNLATSRENIELAVKAMIENIKK